MSEICQAIPCTEILTIFGICAASSLALAIGLLVIAARQIANLEVPPDADFFETLQSIPITVPLALDLLDMAFDVFAAPISWIILELLGLSALQMVTVFEGLIPGTQLIPTLTAAWVISRLMKKKDRQSPVRDALHEYQRRQLSSRRLRSSPALPESRRRRLPPGSIAGDVIEGEYTSRDRYADDDVEYARRRSYGAMEDDFYTIDDDEDVDFVDMDDGDEW